MKKSVILVAIVTFIFVGCNQEKPPTTTSDFDLALTEYEDIYTFPEPTIQIKVTRSSQGKKTEFVIGPDVYDIEDTSVFPIIKWFGGLELTKCRWAPKITEKNVYYDFVVDGKEAFGYYEKGEKAFIFVENKCYKAENPSTPPIE